MKMAQFRSTAPCFVVADIGATIRWYEAQLGFKGNSVKDFYESVRQHVDIIRPLGKQFYGDWEFEVKDPNGYVLVFSELID